MVWRETELWSRGSGEAEEGGDVCAGDMALELVAGAVGTEGCVEGAVAVEAVVKDNAGQRPCGAGPWVTGGAMADGFTPLTIFLRVEGERGVGSPSEIGDGAVEDVEAAGADEQTDIAEAEGVVVT